MEPKTPAAIPTLPPTGSPWHTWVLFALGVITAVVTLFNGVQTDDVKKKVDKNNERAERVEKDLADVKAQFAARPVPVGQR